MPILSPICAKSRAALQADGAWSVVDQDRYDAITAERQAAATAALEAARATTYAAKQAETVRWVAAGRPAAAPATGYPWADDRADLRGVSVAEVLAEWEAVTEAWEAVGRQIERERERVNLLIGAANTEAAIQAARDSATYPSP